LLLAVTTFVSVRGHVSSSTQVVDSEPSQGAPLSATAPSTGISSTPAVATPADQPAAAEKAPEGTVVGGAESGELARGPSTQKYAAEDKSGNRGRASSADEQRTVDAMKKKAAELRRDVTDELRIAPKAEAPATAAHASKPAAPAPAKAAPPPAKAAPPPAQPAPAPAKEEAASPPPGVVAESAGDGYLERERAPSQSAADDEKSRAKDDDLRSQRSSVVAQAPAPAESKPEPQAKPQTKAPAAEPPSTPPAAAPSPPPPPPTAAAPTQTAVNEEANSRDGRDASKNDASKNDANRSEAAKGGKAPARNQAANGGSAQQNNAPSAKNVQAANADSAGNAAGNVTGNDRAAEAPEQQMYRQAQKSAAGGQCADALTLTGKIARMYPDFYKRQRIASDPTIQTCASQQRKNKAQNPAPAKQREVDQSEENKAAK
jgi:hypothetical protein